MQRRPDRVDRRGFRRSHRHRARRSQAGTDQLAHAARPPAVALFAAHAPGGPGRAREGGSFTDVDDAIESRRSLDALLHTPRALLEEEMAEHLVVDEDGLFRYRYSRAAAAAAMELLAEPESELNEVLCPTLLVHGDTSALLSDADVVRAADEIRRCRVETVPGGHAVLWDALAETSAHVRSFLVAKNTA